MKDFISKLNRMESLLKQMSFIKEIRLLFNLFSQKYNVFHIYSNIIIVSYKNKDIYLKLNFQQTFFITIRNAIALQQIL